MCCSIRTPFNGPLEKRRVHFGMRESALCEVFFGVIEALVNCHGHLSDEF